MSQFCGTCGKPLKEGSAFCPACGARQPSAAPPPIPARSALPTAAPSATPQAPASKKGSPLIKIVVAVLGVLALLTVVAMGSCFYIAYRIKKRAQQYAAVLNAGSSSSQPNATAGNGLPSLAQSMSKLGDSIQKPTTSFHVSFKKSGSDGSTYSLEEDVSPSSLTGQETDVSPKTKLGNEEVGGTNVFPRNATAGSPDWQMTVSSIELSYLNPMSNGIRDAQAGVKYVGKEQAGGYDASRYDFDLASVPASEKLANVMASRWLGGMVKQATGKGALLKDFNVKGSAWLAPDDGRMVKFQYDYISMFDDGTQNVTHYEGIVTQK